MKEYIEQVYRRKSARKYLEEPVSQEELKEVTDKLHTLTPLCADIAVEYKILPTAETNCKWNAPFCMLCYSEEKPFWLQNAGYILEQWDLFLASKNWGACWYGWGRTDEKTVNGKKYVIMMSFGKCGEFRTDEKEFSRKSVDVFWKGPQLSDVASIVRLAPSAVNSQPWLVESDGGSLSVYQGGNIVSAIARQLSNWFNKMDMGIFLAFLEVALSSRGVEFQRKLVFDGPSKKQPLAVYTVVTPQSGN